MKNEIVPKFSESLRAIARSAFVGIASCAPLQSMFARINKEEALKASIRLHHGEAAESFVCFNREHIEFIKEQLDQGETLDEIQRHIFQAAVLREEPRTVVAMKRAISEAQK